MAKHTPFWFAAINKAKKRDAAGLVPFTPAVQKKSSVWVTCACGKQDPRIPRTNGFGMPVDHRLAMLGERFADIVCNLQDPDRAMDALLKIEQRSAEILAELDKG